MIAYGDGVTTAASASYNAQKQSQQTARGKMPCSDGPGFVAGDKNRGQRVEDKTGTAFTTRSLRAQSFCIEGSRDRESGREHLFYQKSRWLTCDGDRPDWEIAGRSMERDAGRYGLMKTPG